MATHSSATYRNGPVPPFRTHDPSARLPHLALARRWPRLATLCRECRAEPGRTQARQLRTPQRRLTASALFISRQNGSIVDIELIGRSTMAGAFPRGRFHLFEASILRIRCWTGWTVADCTERGVRSEKLLETDMRGDTRRDARFASASNVGLTVRHCLD